MAENAVGNLTGVRGVTNVAAIKKPAVMPSEVKANIEYALLRAAEVDAEPITVKVVNDKVILKSNVSSLAERGDPGHLSSGSEHAPGYVRSTMSRRASFCGRFQKKPTAASPTPK